jgi:hypothetical protein
MKVTDPQIFRDLASDIEIELAKLTKLAIQIQQVQNDIKAAPAYINSFYGSLALQFHGFYTGCECIFSLISVELNGGVSKNADWHKRMLSRMAIDNEERKAVITLQTAERLEDFLGFRHVIRNIYGFELKIDRIDALVKQYPAAWCAFETDIRAFVDWLREMAIALEP